MRSLLIIGLPRSCSTRLEAICAKALTLKNIGEIMRWNGGYFETTQFAKAFPELQDMDPKMLLQDESFLKRAYDRWTQDHIVRELREAWFIERFSEWCQSRYNILYIQRPYDDILICNNLRNMFVKEWLRPRYEALQRIRHALKDSPSYGSIDYDDLVHDHNILFEILRPWYPEVKAYDYIDAEFTAVREQVLSKVNAHASSSNARDTSLRVVTKNLEVA